MKFEDKLRLLKMSVESSRGEFVTIQKPEARILTHLSEMTLSMITDLKKLRKSDDPKTALPFLCNRYEKLIKSLLEERPAKEHNDNDENK